MSYTDLNPRFNHRNGANRSKLYRPIVEQVNQRKHLINYLINRKQDPNAHKNAANLAKNHPPFLNQLNFMKKLPVHDGCVNTISWNKTGEYLLSGSDDRNLCITKPHYLFDTSQGYQVMHKVPTLHLGNIFSAKFLPNSSDSILVSCSSNGPIIVHDVKSVDPSQGIFVFNCHSSTIFDVVPLEDDDRIFLSCGEDKTVRLFDLRCHRSCARAGTCPHLPYIRNSHAITTLAVHPLNSNLILIGRGDGRGLVYDRRKLPDTRNVLREGIEKERADRTASLSGKALSNYRHPLDGVVSQFSVPEINKKSRFTSLCYSQNGDQVLASYIQDYIYLFNHDKSSNFELAKKIGGATCVDSTNSSSLQSNDNNSDTLSPTANDATACYDNNISQNRTHNTESQPSLARPFFPPRLRVRGDWSDTGVDSTPQFLNQTTGSSIEDDNSSLQTLTNRAIRLFVGRDRSRGSPLTEILAGPLRFRSSNDPREHRRESTESRSTAATLSNHYESRSEDIDGHDGSHNRQEFRNARGSHSANKGERPRQSQISSESKLKFQKFSEELRMRHSQMQLSHPVMMYQGHRNSKTTFKEARFWGDDYIISGSDCGRIFFWDKKTAKIVMTFKADNNVVNCLAPNPYHYALASSGIDYDIKIWSTQSILDHPMKISQAEIDKIVRNNELMLEEARTTITVPPHLFFRFLASISQDTLS